MATEKAIKLSGLLLLIVFSLLVGYAWGATRTSPLINELQAENQHDLTDEEVGDSREIDFANGNTTGTHLPITLSSLKQNSLKDSLHQHIQTWLAQDQLARSNGYTYAIDIAQLMVYFANEGDLENYTTFRNLAVEHLILNDPSDPYTQGFVAWRYQPQQELDASGTTEALWIARGLWLGSQKFNNPSDKELALLILDGYGRHAYVDQDIWLIRNYFNLGARCFSPNSYLVDYYPDFLQEVASTVGDSVTFGDLTPTSLFQNSLDLIHQAKTPSGLLYSIILPEVKTLTPDLNIVVFSPNDIIQFSNTCLVAETVIKSDAQLTQKILNFANKHFDTLKIYYDGSTGEAVTEQAASISEWSCLVRLATNLNDTTMTQKTIKQAEPLWQIFDKNPYEPRLYTAGQILLSIQAMTTR